MLRGPRDGTLEFDAPDGFHGSMPAPLGKARLWLPQLGQWRYTWSTTGEEGVINVTPALPEPDEPAEGPAADEVSLAPPTRDLGRLEVG